MAREIFYRQFDNRRQVAGFLGLVTSPYDSGAVERSQGISRAGSAAVRAMMIQAAWLWIRHQPKSALTRWFLRRTKGRGKRVRRIMIVALARKLAIALWRYLEQGLVPEGAFLGGK
jgi:transposase